MRKRIIVPIPQEAEMPDQDWLNPEDIAELEISSEDPDYPIEFALLADQLAGWRAAGPGSQIIRLIFKQPQALRRIFLKFVETQAERTQEYSLRWSADAGETFEEIVRQQWNFSPSGSTCEIEDHPVQLSAVTVLELCIIPDIGKDAEIASLEQLRLS